MITKRKSENRSRIKVHIRKRVTGTPERPRLTIFRSAKHVYAQIIDDTTSKTLVSVSDIAKDVKGDFSGIKGQMNISKKVGELVAKKAVSANIKEVVFDRNGYLYHGVVKAMADGARAGGLKF
ncbi:MAG: 50S ribosomal protein L18 [Bacteroidetes bacterium]|nr:50S ribosomal protein L18 [Bacteroidota bacterium]MCW5896389.1 50S ribosomal protein L18 [Bacteroidota bacterium]